MADFEAVAAPEAPAATEVLLPEMDDDVASPLTSEFDADVEPEVEPEMDVWDAEDVADVEDDVVDFPARLLRESLRSVDEADDDDDEDDKAGSDADSASDDDDDDEADDEF